MKRLLSFWLLAALLLAPIALYAQTRAQQDPQRLDAAQFVQTSATSAATITITPGSQYVYVTNVEITNCAGGTAVTAATPTTVTTTNLGGAAWTVGSGVTAGLCQPSPINGPFPLALKSSTAG